MIKVLLKHYIYELCIDKLFEQIYRNFDVCARTLADYKVGQFIPKLQIARADGTKVDLFICKVVYKNKNKVVIECQDSNVPTVICIKDNTVAKILVLHYVEECGQQYKDLFDE